ncbi:S8 family peptidase [Pseudobutyrivibrio sp.]|uniref:S8 family peptidase n=1 Tax=Pseudobutyrivibrio sp. TaxID=2014367 RepID=UPI003867BB00
MNNVLQLKGPFQGRRHPRAVVIPTLKKSDEVKAENVRRMAAQLEDALEFWNKENYINGALISAHYKRIVPKTRRISYLFSGGGKTTADCVCGAKFEDNDSKIVGEYNKRHVFTYYISINVLESSIQKLKQCADIIDSQFDGVISDLDVNDINVGIRNVKGMKKNPFLSTVVDCSSVLFFNIEFNEKKLTTNNLISLYKTDESVIDVLRKVGIDINRERLLDDCTVSLRQDQMDLLMEKASYLISMVNDFSKYEVDIPDQETMETIGIPQPHDEPIIGVIDTKFDKRVYFGEWVDYKNMLSEELGDEIDDYFHGTAVSSLIIDGPQINPDLDDGCGRFRVRHFAVAKPNGSSSFIILKAIQKIIKENLDIKVWNLSLGSALEIDENYMSPEAFFLDEIQTEYDVTFVIAGTNDNARTLRKRIGAPADSLNSLVVNAVDCNNHVAEYSRKGPVLGFFFKPDVAYFGGDKNGYMRVCGPLGEANVNGTSFAAPWISRKMAFLVYKMGLSREVAKALIIDAAAGWQPEDCVESFKGYGIVPTHINDILRTKDDEMRFVISNVIDEYETYTYSLPIPVVNGMQPFWSRATMTYFPCCDRSQGVDYTSTEMDLHFGRVFKDKKGNVSLKEINDNKQSTDEGCFKNEESARALYRKWDNVKRISEKIKPVARPKKVYEAGMWGIRIVTKERGSEKLGRGTRFGVVVTFKEMTGTNRIEEFIKLCSLYGWLVTPIDVETKLDLYNQVNEEIEWD